MGTLNFEHAKQYALHRLEWDLSPNLLYHGISHTRDEVVPAAESLANMEEIHGESYCLLLTAAWFHDLGFIEGLAGHEAVGARIVSEVLPGFGYHVSQIKTIQSLIMATVIPQSPDTLLEKIMADADLDVLGRDDFMLRNDYLRRELVYFGQNFTDIEWYTNQLKFIDSHTYFTASARKTRDAGKVLNIASLKRILKSVKR